jgi:ankyrin repeat protein
MFQNIFRKAVEEDNIPLIRRLLDRPDVDPSVNDQYALGSACHYGNTELVRLLLADPRVDPRVDPFQDDDTVFIEAPLTDACENGHTEVVRLLLADSRIDPSADEQVAFRSACAKGQTEIVRLLLTDPRVVPDHPEALDSVCEKGYTEILRIMLAYPSEELSEYAEDALQVACEKGHTEILRLLLEDPRFNPNITEEKADILRTNVTIQFDTIVNHYRHDLPQLLVSVNHALEKEILRKSSKDLTRIQALEQHIQMNPNISNTISSFSGPRNHRNTITRSLYKAKGNYYGPTRAPKKRTRKNRSK